MKRVDIKVGAELFYDRSSNWETNYYSGSKVVVVDNSPYEIRAGYLPRGALRYRKDPAGRAVLVDIYDDRGSVLGREAVPTGHLRGPYEETKAVRAARREQDATAAREAEERSEKVYSQVGQALDAAHLIGVFAGRDNAIRGHVSVSAARFAAMVDALTAAGWRYDPAVMGES